MAREGLDFTAVHVAEGNLIIEIHLSDQGVGSRAYIMVKGFLRGHGIGTRDNWVAGVVQGPIHDIAVPIAGFAAETSSVMDLDADEARRGRMVDGAIRGNRNPSGRAQFSEIGFHVDVARSRQ